MQNRKKDNEMTLQGIRMARSFQNNNNNNKKFFIPNLRNTNPSVISIRLINSISVRPFPFVPIISTISTRQPSQPPHLLLLR